jgi:hypothetical protein
LCIVGGWVITHKVKAVRERLDDINGENVFNGEFFFVFQL